MDENLLAKIKTMTPEQRASMAQVIQAELASRQGGGLDTTSLTTSTKPRGFLPTAVSALENMPNALSIAIRGKPIDEGGMAEKINTLIATEKLKEHMASQTPEGQLARKKAQFELGQGGEISDNLVTKMPTGVEKDEQPPMRIRVESPKYPGWEEIDNPEYKQWEKLQEEARKGLPIETGGKLAMVKQAKQDIQEVKDLLFPDGTPESFKRGLAFASNIPGSRAPILGAVIPQALPFHEKGQKIYSRLQNAVAAKLRVETGAQANPSEVENILARFGVTSASDPQAAWDALQRLENFMDETISITDPTGRFQKSTPSQDNDPLGLR